jgi:N-acetylglucosamine kinase-like BadF-type ATPase
MAQRRGTTDLPVVGVIGGGTATECAVLDGAGDVLAESRTGPSNPTFVSIAEARANVTSALEAALDGIGPCRAAGLSLFGGVADEGDPVADAVLAPLGARTAVIVRYTEHEAALAASGILVSVGVAVVAGTGSSAVAMHDGRLHTAGGWGAVLGDQGSAHDIAITAIRDAIRSSEGTGPAIPTLERRVHDHFGIESLWDLVGRFHGEGVRREQVADLCRVLAADASSDPAIAARFEGAGCDLAALAVAAATPVFAPEAAFDVAMAGGVWKAGAVVETSFVDAVRQAYPHARFHRQVCPPAVGVARRVLYEQETP